MDVRQLGSEAAVPVVGLDGVVDQQPTYRKSGFVLAHRNIRYAARLTGRAFDDVFPSDRVSFDATHFPVPRRAFLKAWLKQPHGKSLVLRDSAGILGFGTVRQWRAGWKIGPLFAAESSIAEELLLALAHHARPTADIFLDVPETNDAAVGLAERWGVEPMFETARRYRGPDPSPSNASSGSPRSSSAEGHQVAKPPASAPARTSPVIP